MTADAPSQVHLQGTQCRHTKLIPIAIGIQANVPDSYRDGLPALPTGQASLPAEPLNVIREDRKNDSILYVGSDGGLYVSFDRGNSFMMWNGGLPKSIPVHDIAIQKRENEMVLGTHGRSLYVSKLDDVQGIMKDPDWMKKKPKEKPREQGSRFDDEGKMEPE